MLEVVSFEAAGNRYGYGWRSFLTRRIEISLDFERDVIRRLFVFVRRLQRPRRNPAPSARAYLEALAKVFGAPAALDAAFPAVATIVLDASSLVALARGEGRARAFLSRGLAGGARIVVPATSLFDPQVALIAEFVAEVLAVDARIIRRASKLMAGSQRSLPFGAITLACASLSAPAAVLTADTGLESLLPGTADQPGVFVFGI